MNEVFVLIGDMRQMALADELRARGIGVDIGSEIKGDYKYVILPYVSFSSDKLNLPNSRLGAKETVRMLKNASLVFAGKYPLEFKEECEKAGIRLIDWFEDEELTVKNAHLTAEGALGIAIEKSPRAINDSFVTVIGYGRVAKACARLFGQAGAHIKIMARSYGARIDAYTRGYKSYEIENELPLREADIVINTVPSIILDEKRLENLRESAIVIELASKPYGTDEAAAARLGIPLYIAPGLPAKVAPLTAGRLMADMAMRYLKEAK